MNKTAIEPKDIRKGDLIRFEYAGGESAHEYRAICDREKWQHSIGQHYLLDRPKPKAELPTEVGFYLNSQNKLWTREHNGDWRDDRDNRRSSSEAIASAPFTKLEPVPVTAKRFADALRKAVWPRIESHWYTSATARDILHQAEKIAEEFRVTD